MAHPGGIAAGVAALRQAWEAAVAGVPLEEFARAHPELQAGDGEVRGLSTSCPRQHLRQPQHRRGEDRDQHEHREAGIEEGHDLPHLLLELDRRRSWRRCRAGSRPAA